MSVIVFLFIPQVIYVGLVSFSSQFPEVVLSTVTSAAVTPSPALGEHRVPHASRRMRRGSLVFSHVLVCAFILLRLMYCCSFYLAFQIKWFTHLFSILLVCSINALKVAFACAFAATWFSVFYYGCLFHTGEYVLYFSNFQTAFKKRLCVISNVSVFIVVEKCELFDTGFLKCVEPSYVTYTVCWIFVHVPHTLEKDVYSPFWMQGSVHSS